MESKSYGKKRKYSYSFGNKGNKRRFYGNTTSSSSSKITSAKAYAPERKCIDVESVQLQFDLAGNQQLLNGAIAGAQSYTRIGRRVCSKTLAIRGQILYGGNNNTFGNDYLRLMLVYDRSPNGAAPATSDVLQSTTNGGGTSTTPFSPLNINNAKRFFVLRDESWSINQVAVVPNMPPGGGAIQLEPSSEATDFKERSFKWFIGKKVRDLITEYNAGATGGIGDITSGALFLMAVGQNGSGNYKVRFTSRWRFCDV